ncbi:MAG: branched-chain amino acid ABC transporter permease [Chloroflexota bacterium]|nr:branched-chain amino acid ABC transporter permease [Chloroflexota bacterium]MDQ6909097.1 branched-chain amino acid ABC transporter permease [Chloroflexota bacterium]
MSTLIFITLTGLALAAMYFLLASGLSLIFGLMDVLNFAHGAFFTWGAYAAWWVISMKTPAGGNASTGIFLLAIVAAVVAGAALATGTEVVLLRPLYKRTIYQVLVTLGAGLALTELTAVIWKHDAKIFPQPRWMAATLTIAGARVPANRLVLIAVAAMVLGLMLLFLRYTRYGLIVRAGAENREMVQALGIDVNRAFTLVFALGGALAGLGGVFGGAYFKSIDPSIGTVNLIFAFIVVVIGGLGSISGSALAAVIIGLSQQYANYYAAAWLGDFVVVILLAVVLLVRPGGLLGARR